MTRDPLEMAILHVQTTERLTLLIEQASVMVDGIGRIRDTDDELAPELGAAVISLSDCVRALRRAHDFSKARFEVASGNG